MILDWLNELTPHQQQVFVESVRQRLANRDASRPPIPPEHEIGVMLLGATAQAHRLSAVELASLMRTPRDDAGVGVLWILVHEMIEMTCQRKRTGRPLLPRPAGTCKDP